MENFLLFFFQSLILMAQKECPDTLKSIAKNLSSLKSTNSKNNKKNSQKCPKNAIKKAVFPIIQDSSHLWYFKKS